MHILVTGTPGSGKTTIANYAKTMNDARFVDADDTVGLCEWRELKTGAVLGLVTEHVETGQDDWYAKYGWYWKVDKLKQFLANNPDAILCGSAENTVECYQYFDKIIIFKKSEDELLSNLASPDRKNPFGKTSKQRQNFLSWQNYLIENAEKYKPIVLTGNDIAVIYSSITRQIS